MPQRADVVIMGGGLAGLTLALQLRRRMPHLEIVVLERRAHPVPVAIHKVGESSVEIGAHYFGTVLGLESHLRSQQLRKFGFRFFFSDRAQSLDGVTELGTSRYLSTPTWQIDRGLFENHLAQAAAAAGAVFLDDTLIEDFALDGAPVSVAGTAHTHQVRYRRGDAEERICCRWLIDASGRAGLIKERLGLQQANAHDANSVWFRIGARIDVNSWSRDAGWLARCEPPDRWLSTNHLVGEGYWVWLIPLASGSHSVGIVADARRHPLKSMSSFERALQWLQAHQPRLAAELAARRGALQDFRFLRNFSYGCRQVFSAARWALTGEAGVFLDPFYSPGSDFIAIGNTYITELIERDLRGEPLAPHARLYEQLFQSFYRNTLSLYLDQYDIFGDPEVLPVKVFWDYTYYWGVLCQLFFQNRLADVAILGRVRGELAATQALNGAMQRFLREWSRVGTRRNPAVLIDQAGLDWFVELNRGLRDPLDDAGFEARVRGGCVQLQALAAEICERALARCPHLDAGAVRALLPAGAAGGAMLVSLAA